MKFSKKLSIRVIVVFFSIFAIAFVLAYFLYLRNIKIYEPVTMSFPGISLKEANKIKVYSITPLDRKIPFPFFEQQIQWVCTWGFHKRIEVEIPDSLSGKASVIEIYINQNKKTLQLKDLNSYGISVGLKYYLIPGYIQGRTPLFSVLWSLTHWKEFKPGIVILAVLFFVILIFSIFIRIKSKLKTVTKNKVYRQAFRNTFNRFLQKPLEFTNLFFRTGIVKFKSMKITKKQIYLWVKIIIVSVLIAFSLFFGYLFFRFNLATLVTSVLFILMCGLFLWFLIRIITYACKTSGAVKEKWYFALSILIILWLAFELFLRLAGINKSYSEKVGLYYSSGFIEYDINSKDHQGLMIHSPYHSYIDKRKEFAYEMKCNSEGLRDIDHPVKKDSNEFRIICLGNSFTEGIGAPQDSTWPGLLGKRIKHISGKKITVFNAGMSGSDPFFHYALLEKRLLKYQPDLVLLTLGSSDFEFYRFRGGFERFTTEGVRFREAPRLEPLYALSYIVRLFVNDVFKYKELLSPSEYKADSIRAKEDTENCIYRFHELSLKKGFTLIVVFIDDTGTGYDSIKSKLLTENKIRVIDLFQYTKEIEKITPLNHHKYYWPVDGHCRSTGYEVMAKGVLWNLEKMGIIDSLICK
ncbi:MAG: GDSL-type esterase/lipase family protein [Bacteroidales bacterium]|jgi:hypothetical protein|nr:GDSL-type esterase/lipase family protein [Bacteroidales bacterium]MDD4214448.1 GDSL-type esterase/lipase family protein [Bacteroidales bacterium]